MTPMTRRGAKRWKRDQGSSLVEFSLITFMFIIVLLGVVEMGRMVLVYTTVANAARVGARYAINHGSLRTGSGVDGPSGPGNPCTCSQIQTVVQNFASAGLLDTSKLTITVTYPDGVSVSTPGGNNLPGSRVVVSVTYPYDPFVTFFNSMLGITMGSSSEGVIVY